MPKKKPARISRSLDLTGMTFGEFMHEYAGQIPPDAEFSCDIEMDEASASGRVVLDWVEDPDA